MIRWPAVLLLGALAAAGQSSVESRWKGLQFLFGNWRGVGGGEPGAGSGKFSFQADLNGQILVRRNSAEVGNGTRHDDLLVVYADAPGGAMRGMYFDSEGHVIRYRVAMPAPQRVVFESEGERPKYRLSYWMEQESLKGKFEVGDRTYLEWSAERI